MQNKLEERGTPHDGAYQASLDHARAILRLGELPLSPEGSTCLTYALAASELLRPLIDNRHTTPSLLTQTGGPEYNPHLAIDEIGGDLVRMLLTEQSAVTPVKLFVEETPVWQFIPDHPLYVGKHLVMVDPVDETSALTAEPPRAVQSTSIVITRPDGSFEAAAIASLVDQRIIMTEGNYTTYLFYDHNTKRLQMEYPIQQPWRTESKTLRVAVLPRRLEAIKELSLFHDPEISINIQPTFGGFALLDMLFPIGAPTDVMVDITKGQPWYELWGYVANQAGAISRGNKGQIIHTEHIIQYASRHKVGPRVPVLICRNQEIYNFVAPRLGIPVWTHHDT